jgi:hypothetical protein
MDCYRSIEVERTVPAEPLFSDIDLDDMAADEAKSLRSEDDDYIADEFDSYETDEEDMENGLSIYSDDEIFDPVSDEQ